MGLGSSWGGLGSVVGALGPSWWVLVTQGLDPKAILAIPGGHGGGGWASHNLILSPRLGLSWFAPAPRGQLQGFQGPMRDPKDLED